MYGASPGSMGWVLQYTYAGGEPRVSAQCHVAEAVMCGSRDVLTDMDHVTVVRKTVRRHDHHSNLIATTLHLMALIYYPTTGVCNKAVLTRGLI